VGKNIKNLREIFKDGSIICWKCLSNDIEKTHGSFQSIEDGIEYSNQEIVCNDCKTEFMYTVEKDSEDEIKFKNVFGKDDEESE
jgi:predicted secreted protein